MLPLILQAELLGRLTLAVILGAVLGWERQMGQHPAGLRTHILVTLGAAAYTIAGTYGVAGHGTVQDAGRVAAQVVAGIGFLGAGTIWRSGSDRIIYGLTTAASIWLAASIGMLAGFGQYLLAAGCAFLGFMVLRLMKGLEEVPSRVSSWRRRRALARARHDVLAAETGAEPSHPHRDPTTTSSGDTIGADGTDRDSMDDGTGDPHDPTLSEVERTPAPHLPVVRHKRTGKKGRKRKRRDAEREAEAQISDAPRT